MVAIVTTSLVVFALVVYFAWRLLMLTQFATKLHFLPKNWEAWISSHTADWGFRR